MRILTQLNKKNVAVEVNDNQWSLAKLKASLSKTKMSLIEFLQKEDIEYNVISLSELKQEMTLNVEYKGSLINIVISNEEFFSSEITEEDFLNSDTESYLEFLIDMGINFQVYNKPSDNADATINENLNFTKNTTEQLEVDKDVEYKDAGIIEQQSGDSRVYESNSID